jgi:Kef-type K+ transport system membrane component KefB
MIIVMNQATAHAAHLFLQLTVIIAACRMCGMLMRRIGQPPVIGEMVAGVLLGPSLFGMLAPGISAALFPVDERPVLFAIAQLGLTLYMFAVGLEFRTDLLRSNARTAVSVSLAGIIMPFILGAIVALWLVGQEGFFTPGITPGFAVLFLGAAMSITAFPMLARMIIEHRLTGTAAGTIALTAGSIDDVAAWILLAAVLGGISGQAWLFAVALVGGIIYTLACLKVCRPLLAWLDRRQEDRTTLGVIALLLMVGAWFTDFIGLYSVFGAFILGMAVPRGGLAEKTAERIGPVTSAILLPVFFTYSGLNTKIDLVDTPWLWLVTGVIILASIGGKLAACYGAARWTGCSRPDALTIASLMNARGLMELILLNIALQAGLITQTLFTIMVIMAIVTTLMAAPGFNLANRWRRG